MDTVVPAVALQAGLLAALVPQAGHRRVVPARPQLQ